MEYIYDAFNRRIARYEDANGVQSGGKRDEFFFYDGENAVLDAVDADGTGGQAFLPVAARRYLWGEAVDQLLAQENIPASGTPTLANLYWIMSDRLGSTGDANNASGTVKIHNDYDAFGEKHQTITGTIDPNDVPRYLYTCQEYDIITGLYDYGRPYDPEIGKFYSEDSAGLDVDENLYRYCWNNVVNMTDPTGNCGQYLGYGTNSYNSGSSVIDLGANLYGSAYSNSLFMDRTSFISSISSGGASNTPMSLSDFGGSSYNSLSTTNFSYSTPASIFDDSFSSSPSLSYSPVIPSNLDANFSQAFNSVSENQLAMYSYYGDSYTPTVVNPMVAFNSEPYEPYFARDIKGVSTSAEVPFMAANDPFDFELDSVVGSFNQRMNVAYDYNMAVLQVASQDIPGPGEMMDIDTLFAKDSTVLDRSLSGASLAVNLVTAGFAPNFGRVAKATHIADKIEDMHLTNAQKQVANLDNIKPYNQLQKEIREAGLSGQIEAHKLVEKRHNIGNVMQSPAVPLPKGAEGHQIVTNLLRQSLPYNVQYYSQQVLESLQKVYKEFPKWLDTAVEWINKNPKK